MSKKTIRLLIISAAVLLLLAAALVILLNLQESEVEDPSGNQNPITNPLDTIFSPDFEEVDYVFIKNSRGEITLKIDEYWSVYIPDFNIPLNTDNAFALFFSATNVSSRQIISEAGENLSEYGLDNENCYFEVKLKDGTVTTFILGNDTPLTDGVYAMKKGESTVYMLDSSALNLTNMSSADCMDLVLTPELDTETPEALAKISKIRINSESTGYEDIELTYIAYEDYTGTSPAYFSFYLSNPETGIGLNENYFKKNIAPSLSGITALYGVAAHPSAEQLAEFGLDKPYGTFHTVISGVSYTFDVSRPSTGGTAFVYMRERDAIYLVTYSESFGALDVTLFDMQSRFLFIDIITNFEYITVVDESGTSEFVLSGVMFDENNPFKVTHNGKYADPDEFKKLYTLMMSLFIDGTIKEGDIPGDEVLKITYKYVDSEEEITLRYSTIDVRRCAAMLNGKDVEYYTLRKNIDNFKAAFKNYVNGVPINIYSTAE